MDGPSLLDDELKDGYWYDESQDQEPEEDDEQPAPKPTPLPPLRDDGLPF